MYQQPELQAGFLALKREKKPHKSKTLGISTLIIVLEKRIPQILPSPVGSRNILCLDSKERDVSRAQEPTGAVG